MRIDERRWSAREVAAISPNFDVFPSTEAVLLEARDGAFAGCISATANLNADLCCRAWREGDRNAYEKAVAIRKLFDGKALVPGIKTVVAHIRKDFEMETTHASVCVVSGCGQQRSGDRL